MSRDASAIVRSGSSVADNTLQMDSEQTSDLELDLAAALPSSECRNAPPPHITLFFQAHGGPISENGGGEDSASSTDIEKLVSSNLRKSPGVRFLSM